MFTTEPNDFTDDQFAMVYDTECDVETNEHRQTRTLSLLRLPSAVEPVSDGDAKEYCKDVIGEESVDFGPYVGEFGYEITDALPHAYFLAKCGLLRSTRGCGWGLGALYYFSPNHTDDISCARIQYRDTETVSDAQCPWPSRRSSHDPASSFSGARLPSGAVKPLPWLPVPYRKHFLSLSVPVPDSIAVQRRRLFFVSNKYQAEGGKLHDAIERDVPVNFLSLTLLRWLFTRLRTAGFLVIYRRPADGVDVIKDASHQLQFLDHLMIQQEFAEDVIDLSSLDYNASGIGFNDLQLRYMARARCFASVQGGNARLLGLFGGHHIILSRVDAPSEHGGFWSDFLPALSGQRIYLTRNDAEFVLQVENLITSCPCLLQL